MSDSEYSWNSNDGSVKKKRKAKKPAKPILRRSKRNLAKKEKEIEKLNKSSWDKSQNYSDKDEKVSKDNQSDYTLNNDTDGHKIETDHEDDQKVETDKEDDQKIVTNKENNPKVETDKQDDKIETDEENDQKNLSEESKNDQSKSTQEESLNFESVMLTKADKELWWVCLTTENSDTNWLTKCSTCNLIVHQHCFGSELQNHAPSADWTCHRCSYATDTNLDPKLIKCFYCHGIKGAIKQIDNKHWAHIVCINWFADLWYEDEM